MSYLNGMPYLNEISVFLLGFGLVTIMMVGVRLFNGFRWFANKPKRDHVILGNDMRGRSGFVEEVSPCGKHCFVTVGTERWRACLSDKDIATIKAGDMVNVKSVKGLTLQICPAKN